MLDESNNFMIRIQLEMASQWLQNSSALNFVQSEAEGEPSA